MKHAFHYDGTILEIGLPRNDIFWQDAFYLKNEIKNSLNIDSEYKLLLYAPTYRDNLSENGFILEISSIIDSLTRRFGGKWKVLYRAHYFEKNSELVQCNLIINVSCYSDMQELLYIADVLITDYSSSMWDFSFTNKPCFLYTPDIDKYMEYRNFFVPPSQWHFPLANNIKELQDNILSYDALRFKEDMVKHHNEYGSFENGMATEKICKLLNDICQ